MSVKHIYKHNWRYFKSKIFAPNIWLSKKTINYLRFYLYLHINKKKSHWKLPIEFLLVFILFRNFWKFVNCKWWKFNKFPAQKRIYFKYCAGSIVSRFELFFVGEISERKPDFLDEKWRLYSSTSAVNIHFTIGAFAEFSCKSNTTKCGNGFPVFISLPHKNHYKTNNFCQKLALFPFSFYWCVVFSFIFRMQHVWLPLLQCQPQVVRANQKSHRKCVVNLINFSATTMSDFNENTKTVRLLILYLVCKKKGWKNKTNKNEAKKKKTLEEK